MGIGANGKQLVMQFALVDHQGRQLLGELVVPAALAQQLSDKGTAGLRVDWIETEGGAAPVTLAGDALPDLPPLQGSLKG